MDEVDVKALENPEKDLIGGFILGDTNFVNWVQETFLFGRDDEKEIPQLKKLRIKISLDTILSG